MAAAKPDADAWLELSLTPEVEKEQVLRVFNPAATEFPDSSCVHELVAARTASTPHAVALEWRGKVMSYAELQSCAEKVAAWLIAHGVVPDSVVTLQLHRSLEQVVGVYGSLLSGGAYLPLDPSWPLHRRRFIVQDAQCRCMVVQGEYAAECSGWFDGAMLRLDDARRVPAVARQSAAKAQRVQPHHLAYIIFTSGSTGKPKGVMVPHMGVVNLLHGLR